MNNYLLCIFVIFMLLYSYVAMESLFLCRKSKKTETDKPADVPTTMPVPVPIYLQIIEPENKDIKVSTTKPDAKIESDFTNPDPYLDDNSNNLNNKNNINKSYYEQQYDILRKHI